MDKPLLYVFVGCASFLFADLIRRYSLKNNLFDTPNERSSHSRSPTRGGGLSGMATLFRA